jgi:hypothetical protein
MKEARTISLLFLPVKGLRVLEKKGGCTEVEKM